MEVYLDGVNIDVWEVIDLLDKNQSMEISKHLNSILSTNYSHSEDITIQDREFEKACEKLRKHRGMLPKEIEEQIIEAAKKYTLYY